MLSALVLAAALAAPDATIVRYDVEETTRALTPAGPRNRALTGTIRALGGKALWELSGARFPGVAARAAIAERGTILLLDPDASAYTPASSEEFDSLFVTAPGPDGVATAEMKDVAASVDSLGGGTPFEGRPTTRFRISVSFVLVSTQAGRVVRLKHEAGGIIETVAWEDAAVPTLFDGVMRLFRVRGEAREALVAELSKVTGLPVRIRLEASSEAISETVGPGGVPGAAPPVRSTWTSTRTLSRLERRKATDADRSAFVVPESYHVRPLDQGRMEGPQPR